MKRITAIFLIILLLASLCGIPFASAENSAASGQAESGKSGGSITVATAGGATSGHTAGGSGKHEEDAGKAPAGRHAASGKTAEDSETEESKAGNLTAGKDGIVLDGNGKFDLLVAGTLSGGGTPILISESVTPDNVTITVWKVENLAKAGDNEEHVVLEGEPGETPAVTDDSKSVEAAIHYIIRIKPDQEEMIDLEGTEKNHGYETATEGSAVTLKISVPKGHKLTDVFNGDGEKVPLDRDASGNYHVTVPRGGGVWLSAEMEETDEGFGKAVANRVFTVSWESAPRTEQPSGSPGKDREGFRIVFDLNGGILNGDRGPITVSAEPGETVELLEAPTKKGARFVRWAPSAEDITVSAPGETFTVTHGVTFTAVWEEDQAEGTPAEGGAAAAPAEGAPGGSGQKAGDGEEDEDEDKEKDEDDEEGDVMETVSVKGLSGGEDIDRDIDGDLKVEGNPAVGIEIEAEGTEAGGKSAVEIDVDGAVTVTGGDQGATGIKVSVSGPMTLDAEVEPDDGVTVTSSDGSGIGIEASASRGGTLTFELEGSATSDGTGVVLHAQDGSVTLLIGEDKE